MNQLFEYGDIINRPIECFYFNSEHNRFPVRAHWHYYMEVLYMQEGVATIVADNITYRLFPGDLILFHPQSIHAIDSDAPIRFAGFKFDINVMNQFQSSSLKLRNIFRNAKANNMPIYFPAGSMQGFDAFLTFHKCIDEIHHQSYGTWQLIQCRINELLIAIIRQWISDEFVIDDISYHEDTYDIYTITEYIDQHLSAELTVPEIAEACNMSYSYFAKKFPAVYGKTCKEYLEERRLYKVEEYLLYTNFDLNYIAQETGFSDCSHMIKSFKKKHKETPKKYRDMHRKAFAFSE